MFPSPKRVDIDIKSFPWYTRKLPNDREKMSDSLRLTFDRAELEVRIY
jgi:hypothetical protein